MVYLYMREKSKTEAFREILQQIDLQLFNSYQTATEEPIKLLLKAK